MKVTTLNAAASLAAAAVEDFGTLTPREARRVYAGDGLALFVYQEVRESFEGGRVTAVGIREARSRIDHARQELESVTRTLEEMEAP
jgi:hypothetical protein